MDENSSRLTSASLIAGVQAGEEDAWVRMTTLFGPHVFKWVRDLSRRTIQPNDISDISQEVFLTATQKIATYQHLQEKNGSFRGWLYGITRHKVLQFQRKHQNNPINVENLDSVTHFDSEDSEFDVVSDSSIWQLKPGHTHEAVESVRKKTDSHNWQEFWRIVIHDEEPAAVAEDLGMSPRTARQAKYRTAERLKNEIEKRRRDAGESPSGDE